MVDSTLVKGPLQNRKCTDCLCLLIFIAFLGGMSWMTIEGYILGDVNYMLAPISSQGDVCGYGATSDFPYLYIYPLSDAVSPMIDFFNYGYCAQSCPKGGDENV